MDHIGMGQTKKVVAIHILLVQVQVLHHQEAAVMEAEIQFQDSPASRQMHT